MVIGKFEYEGKDYQIACNVTDHAIYTNEKEETISTYITEEIKKKSFIPDTKVERVFLNLFYPIRTTAYYISGKKVASKQDVFSTEVFFMPVDSTDEELIEYVSGIFNDDEVFPKATVNLSYEGDVETLEKVVNLDNISGNSIIFRVNCSNGEFEAYNFKKDSKDVIFVKHTYHREYEADDLARYVYDERLEYNYYPDTAEKDITSQKTFDTSDFSFEYSSEENVFAVLNLPKDCFANVYIKDTKGVNRVYYKYSSNNKEIYCDIVDCGDGWYEIKSEKLEWIFNDGTIVLTY